MSYSIERQVTVSLGETLAVGPYRIRFEGLSGAQQPTHYRVHGNFRVFNNGDDLGLFHPTLKFFPLQQSPVGRAVHRSTFAEDLYLILSGFSELEKNQATLKVLLRPLVVWIWLGGAVIALGTLLAVWPFKQKAEGRL